MIPNRFSVGMNTYGKSNTVGATYDSAADQEDDDKEDEDSLSDVQDIPKRNAVTFFRSLFESLNQEGVVQVLEEEDFVFGPVSGKQLVEVELKKIMPSNAKPLLIEARAVDKESTGETKYAQLLLLKQGDDLRKDLAVMLMFKFMNELWRENDINCNRVPCESLCYEVIPMATDFGVIEFIDGAKKISKIGKMINQKDNNGRLKTITNKVIATAAAS